MAAQEVDLLLAAGPPRPGLASSAAWTHRVATLRELVDRASAALPPLPSLRRAALQLFVADILETTGSRARGLLAAGTEPTGAARPVAAAIAELRMAGLSAGDVAHAARESRGGSSRLAVLADVLERYESRLADRDVRDDARLHREIVALVERGLWPSGIDRLEVRGLYDVTPLQGELLLALARRARSVRIEVPFDPHDEESTVFAMPYVRMWEGLDEPAIDVELVFQEPWGEAAPEVSFAVAADPSAEARLVAEWTRERAEEGCGLEEIGIVLAGGAGRLAPIARELSRRGIAFHARRSTPLSETPLVAALLLPFRLFEDGFRRADLVAWVTSSLTPRLDPELLRPALARGPAGGGRLSDWNRAIAAARGDSGATLTSVLRDLERLARTERSPSRFWDEYGSILSRVGLEPSSMPVTPDVWAAWDEALADLREALENLGGWEHPAVGWRTHRRHLATVLSDRRASEGRAGRGVSILTPQDARGLRFRYAAIVGLVQGSLLSPRPAAAVLGDDERAALNEVLGRRVFRLAAEEAREGSLLLGERLRATAGRALLSHAETDEAGNPLLPALEAETLRSVLGGDRIHGPDVDHPWLLRRSAARVAQLQRVERGRAAFFALPAGERGDRASRHDGAFAPPWVAAFRREFGDDDGAQALWSVSRLETWSRCPHQFFQRYVLRLEPPEARPLEAEATVVGRVVHLALEDLYTTRLVDAPDRDRIEEALARAASHREISTIEQGDPEVWKATLRRAAAVLEQYFRYLWRKPPDAFRTVGREIEFGRDGELPPIPLDTALGPIGLRGRVDRLDRDESTGRMRVVDYKYSKAARHRPSVDPERCGVSRFQLYVYFLAARAWADRYGHPGPSEVEGCVHCLRQPFVLETLVSPAPEVIERRIAAVVEEAARGVFDASPREPDDCRFCDFRRSCRIATVAGPLPAGASEDEP